MCVQVTKIANQFEISSLLENILLKQVRWCLTFVGLYIINFLRNKYYKEQILHKIFSDPEINCLRNKHCGRLRVLVI